MFKFDIDISYHNIQVQRFFCPPILHSEHIVISVRLYRYMKGVGSCWLLCLLISNMLNITSEVLMSLNDCLEDGG